MQRAQDKIDCVTEQERLPTFDDWDRLLFITAIILEVLRYNTVTLLGKSSSLIVADTWLIFDTRTAGLPHSVVQDDIYDGMLIPQGSMVCANLWCVYGSM
jgi:hypothetical protein